MDPLQSRPAFPLVAQGCPGRCVEMTETPSSLSEVLALASSRQETHCFSKPLRLEPSTLFCPLSPFVFAYQPSKEPLMGAWDSCLWSPLPPAPKSAPRTILPFSLRAPGP